MMYTSHGIKIKGVWLFKLWGQIRMLSRIKSSQVGPIVSAKWSDVLPEFYDFCHRLVVHAIFLVQKVNITPRNRKNDINGFIDHWPLVVAGVSFLVLC